VDTTGEEYDVEKMIGSLLMIVLLSGCAANPKFKAGACATAVFLGHTIGLPMAIACAVSDEDRPSPPEDGGV
jgi:hypothetical protein